MSETARCFFVVETVDQGEALIEIVLRGFIFRDDGVMVATDRGECEVGRAGYGILLGDGGVAAEGESAKMNLKIFIRSSFRGVDQIEDFRYRNLKNL